MIKEKKEVMNNVAMDIAKLFVQMDIEQLINMQRFIRKYFCFQNQKSPFFKPNIYDMQISINRYPTKELTYQKYKLFIDANPIILKLKKQRDLHQFLYLITKSKANQYLDFINYLIKNYNNKETIKRNLAALNSLCCDNFIFDSNLDKKTRAYNSNRENHRFSTFSDGFKTLVPVSIDVSEYLFFDIEGANFIISCYKTPEISRVAFEIKNLNFATEALPKLRELYDYKTLTPDMNPALLDKIKFYFEVKNIVVDLKKYYKNVYSDNKDENDEAYCRLKQALNDTIKLKNDICSNINSQSQFVNIKTRKKASK